MLSLRRMGRSDHRINSQRPTRLMLELLEPRLLLTHGLFGAEFVAHPLFAPGTPQWYVDQVEHAEESTRANGLAPIAQFQFNDGDRWAGTTQSGGGLAQGDPTTVTWSVVPDGTNINGFIGEAQAPSNLVSTFRGIYGVANNPADTNYQGEAWFEAIESSFNRWSEVSGVTYVYEANDDGANFGFSGGVSGVRGDVRIGGHTLDGNSGTLAYNFFPDTSDMVIDTADGFYSNTTGNSLRLRNVIAHEAGHGLGVAHVESNNASFLMEPFINLGFDGPQLDDILAVQRGYGDANESNDTIGSATPLGAIGAGQTITIGADGTDSQVAASDVSFVSVDDNSDTDYYSFDVSGTSTLNATLTPIGPTYNQGPQNGSQSPLVTSQQSDLTLQVLSSTGVVLATANSAGLGGTEVLTGVNLAGGGTYLTRISGANNAVQLYQLDVTVQSSAPIPGVTVLETGGSTNVAEGGAIDTYSIVLDTQPAGDVTIAVNNGSQLDASTAALVFNAGNWDQQQTVTVSAVDDTVVEGTHTGTIVHSATSSDGDYNGISVANVTATIIDNDAPPPGDDFYFSVQSNSTINGLSVRNEDIVVYDGTSVSLLFDGSDVGLAGLRIDAFDVISETEILLSFDAASGSVDDSDVIRFQATSLGNTTAGSFFWYLDGSDVGLTRSGEDIDAITQLDDGTILLSTSGSSNAGGFSFRDEDVVRFRPNSLGSATSGTFEEFVDGSDAGFALSQSSGEDIDGLAVADGKLHLTSVGNFSVPGISGTDDDVFVYDTAQDAYESELFLSLSGNDLKGLDFPGTASASQLGLGNGGALINPYVPQDGAAVTAADGFAGAQIPVTFGESFALGLPQRTEVRSVIVGFFNVRPETFGTRATSATNTNDRPHSDAAQRLSNPAANQTDTAGAARQLPARRISQRAATAKTVSTQDAATYWDQLFSSRSQLKAIEQVFASDVP